MELLRRVIIDDEGNAITNGKDRVLVDYFGFLTTSFSAVDAGTEINLPVVVTGGKSPITFSAIGLPSGSSISSSGIITGQIRIGATYDFNISATDAEARTITKTFSLVVNPRNLRYGFKQAGVELFAEALEMDLADGSDVSLLTDISNHARDLTASSNFPTFEADEINEKPVISWDGTNDKLSNDESFSIQSGWIVMKFNEDTEFTEFQGVVTGMEFNPILVSNNSGIKFFDLSRDGFGFRSNDKAYKESNAPAPLGEFALVYFEYDLPTFLNGVQLGADRQFAGREYDGDIALLVLSSKKFSEKEIRARSENIAEAYGLQLAEIALYNRKYFIPNRYIAKEPDWEKVTDSVTYQDGGKAFNELNDTAPTEWQFTFTTLTQTEAALFDAHYNSKRLSTPFEFTDKFGEVQTVHYKSYNRNHEGHKSWKQQRQITLIKYP